MSWKRRFGRDLIYAASGAVIANAIYFGLLFTHLHGFAVKALGPAVDIENKYISPMLSEAKYSVEFAVNIVLYTFWIFVALTLLHLPRTLERRRSAATK